MTIKFKNIQQDNLENLANAIGGAIFVTPKEEKNGYIIGGLTLLPNGTLTIKSSSENIYFRRLVLMMVAEVENRGFVTESLHFD